ncbi:MAG: ABC transporter permease [Desulfobacteraceae bacterium]|jgi:ABC-type lipoprotein release transport system permease subunit
MQMQLAWRNIWRNPRRTLVILTAVVIGVWSMIFLGALMRGVADQFLQNGIATLTGHIQIHHRGFRDDPVIQNRISNPEILRRTLKKTLPPGSQWTERIRVNAIVNNARHARGVTLVGVDPVQEARVSFIGHAVVEGTYLEPNDRQGILVGRSLVEDFETRLDRRLVLMSRDTNGEVASRAFRIRGLFRAEMEATEKQFVFVTDKAAREMLGLENEITEVSVLLPSHGQALNVAQAIREDLDTPSLSIQSWQDLLPMVRVMLELYDTFIFIWFLVVFIAMAFGIVNTLLMAVFERIREFGLLKALGLKPRGIVQVVLVESLLLLVLGTTAGNLLGILSTSALAGTGIDLSSLAAGLEYVGMPRVIFPQIQWLDFVLANAVVLVLGLVVSLYPALKAARFTPVEALMHV